MTEKFTTETRWEYALVCPHCGHTHTHELSDDGYKSRHETISQSDGSPGLVQHGKCGRCKGEIILHYSIARDGSLTAGLGNANKGEFSKDLSLVYPIEHVKLLKDA